MGFGGGLNRYSINVNLFSSLNLHFDLDIAGLPQGLLPNKSFPFHCI